MLKVTSGEVNSACQIKKTINIISTQSTSLEQGESDEIHSESL